MRKSTIIWLGLSFAAGAFLFHTTQQVTDGRERLSKIEKNIRNEEETLRVLQAEWSYLNQAERLEKLARQHLSLDSMKGKQFIRLQDLDQMERSPIAAEAEKTVHDAATAALAAGAEEQEKLETAATPKKTVAATPAPVEPKKPAALQKPIVAQKPAPAKKETRAALKSPTTRIPPAAPKKTAETKKPDIKKQSAQQDPRQFGDLMKSLGVR